MSKIDKDRLKNIPNLCRIHCSEKELEEITEKILSILEFMKQIDEVDVDDIPPCNHVLEHIFNVFREDEVGKSENNELLDREKFLKNSVHVGGLVKVPNVIKY